MTTDVEIEKLKINVLKKRQYDSIDPSDEELYLISDAYENIVYLETVADTAPETIVDGVMYYNTTDGKLYEYDLANEQWDDIGDPTVEVLYIDKEHRTAYVYTDNHQFIQISSSGGAGNVDDETTTLNEQDQISVIGVKEKRAGAIKYDWIGTKQQYDNLQSYNDNWIYYITDDAETTDNNMSMNNVYNRLNRAYAWTYRTVNGNGGLYAMTYKNNEIYISDAFSGLDVIPGYQTGNGYFNLIIDGKLYKVSNSNTRPTQYTQIGSDTFWTDVVSNLGSGYAIGNGDLYTLSGSSLTLKDSGGWSKISAPTTGSNQYVLGIKNDSLYYIDNNGNIGILDSSGIWTKIYGNTNCWGIKDGKLYYINSNKSVSEMSSDTTWTDITNTFGINNKKLYRLNSSGIILLNDTETWIKISDTFMLTESGKLFAMGQNNTIVQIGSDNTWTDIAQNLGINNGNVYCLYSSGNTWNIVQITTIGGFSKVFGTYSNISDIYNLLFYGWTGSTTEDIHTVYTVPNPQIGFHTYTNENCTTCSTISAINTNTNNQHL